MQYRLILRVLLWLVVSGGVALGQEAPVLLVSLRDTNDKPVAGARVIIRDSAGERDIARRATDAHGVATFAALNESDIRVAIEGQLPNGAKLYQPGNDARGMLVFLRAPTTRVNLLADSDGLVAPDPLTMSALEAGIPVVTAAASLFPTATASRATPQPTLAALAGRGADVGPAGGTAETEAASAQANPVLSWLVYSLLGLLIGLGIGFLVFQLSRRER